MKTMELENFEVMELASEELKSIEGGFFASGATWFWRGFQLGFGVGAASGTAYLVAQELS